MPLLALLFFGAGLLVQIPTISAQEAPQSQLADEEALLLPSENPRDPREGEASLPLGDAPQYSQDSSIWPVIRMVLTLALVAAAVYGIVFFIKRSSKQPSVSDPFLKILATAHLGANRYAHIVAVGAKAWLLGSSDGGVNLIGEIDDKDILNAMLLDESQKSAAIPAGRLPDFMGLLRRLGVQANPKPSSADEIAKRRERLKGL